MLRTVRSLQAQKCGTFLPMVRVPLQKHGFSQFCPSRAFLLCKKIGEDCSSWHMQKSTVKEVPTKPDGQPDGSRREHVWSLDKHSYSRPWHCPSKRTSCFPGQWPNTLSPSGGGHPKVYERLFAVLFAAGRYDMTMTISSTSIYNTTRFFATWVNSPLGTSMQ